MACHVGLMGYARIGSSRPISLSEAPGHSAECRASSPAGWLPRSNPATSPAGCRRVVASDAAAQAAAVPEWRYLVGLGLRNEATLAPVAELLHGFRIRE